MVQSAARPFLPGLWLTRTPQAGKLPSFIPPWVGDKLERGFAVRKTPTARQAHPKPVTAIIQKGYLAVSMNHARHLNSGLCRVFEAVPQLSGPRVGTTPQGYGFFGLFFGKAHPVYPRHTSQRPRSSPESASEYGNFCGLPQIRRYILNREHTAGVFAVQVAPVTEYIQHGFGFLRT